MKFLAIFLISLFTFSFTLKDINDDVSASLKQGSVTELVKLFSERVSIKVLLQEDLVSKSKAQAIIADFFNKNGIST